ncbi:forkhead box protein N3 isoform X1 [Lepisosteus oculatus]|uniref:forkhead box protein N3 isoform X1 n=1 Tax=Lepisosteus oculatus TaxID=7918 RepID=UPI0003EAC6A1|nr:PREDICTED: forkhead box protein N3 isoform X1 [Lepisosteus oculatus]XP_015205700.1 PREDICTED: forkhead box protein N3 isoform X1 [Lepisosteus oculatus]XP_015205701.1 PREDICTED: forkhead box protein N3 isoform X1 [Lepisosteus oculatus]XP_015205702.1 PREDICTED: forkhead box protein N3 isoform X1 [Lepisosteus oculatus]XP_015205703.1 PREDICTED: forkhead box protein N3 isoform X1 [Lepisosteus oculatus]XP_015205704.1 PREDICTED: forkhead box protein N3 isoform X1 [Lepisosteus oculatus]XP_01520570
MGPVMPPSKKPEGSGVSVASGLSQYYQGSSLTKALQEAEELDLSLPTTKLEKGPMEDEELTNLNWLHESKNLLNSFGDSVLRSVSPVQEIDDDTPPSPAHSDLPYDAKQNPNCKPPYSFSCLIFMAIEDSPAKRLPVKDIYNWILEHFPYFANAPTGWKNSVRHNLSLNKCFKKVDKDRSQSIGKGSLWCIDPEYRQNLIQALKKTPYHPYSQVFNTPPTSPQAYPSMPSAPLWPGSPFFRKNGGVLLQDPDIDAAATMMLLNTPDLPASLPQGVIQNGARMGSQGIYPGIRPLPINPIGSRTGAVRAFLGGCRVRSDSEPSCGSPVVSSDPKEDHNYSSAKSALRRSASPAGSSAAAAADSPSEPEAEDEDRRPARRESRDALADAGGLAPHKKRQHLAKAKQKVSADTLPLKKRRTEKPPESDDEEMKEAAGSLLHLAGVRACLNNITNRTAKGQKEQKESMKN